MPQILAKQTLLDALDSYLPDFVGAVCHLFKNDYEPTSLTTLADLDEANFSGYVPVPLSAFTPATWDDELFAYSTSDTVTFTRDVGMVSNDIYGYYVTDAGGTELLCAERGDEVPVPMVNANIDVLDVAVVLTLFNASEQ